MKISVVIHNLNRATALERCLASVEMQTYRPLELVVLDAGSEDSSRAVIENATERMRAGGIEVRFVPCSPMGVSKSRNFGARRATGDVLVMMDNDACLTSADSSAKVAELFERCPKVAVACIRLLNRDTDRLDPFGWVYRRPPSWSSRFFHTFTFAGGCFAIRAVSFWEAGGFWEQLQYSREEEELALGLIDNGWDLVFIPTVAARHYFDPEGRVNVVQRRWLELKNGILVLWRRFPLALAIPAILGRTATMSLKMLVRHHESPLPLASAVVTAAREWRQSGLTRLPVSFRSTWRYARLHFHFFAERG
jgi:GT2 family glycosyltransferase